MTRSADEVSPRPPSSCDLGLTIQGRMVHVTFTTQVKSDIKTAFTFLSDWTYIEQWDPNVPKSKKASEGPVAVGTKFDIVSMFKGTPSDMTYEILEYAPPNRVLLKGENDKVDARDEITLKEVPDKPGMTEVKYVADINLKGFVSLFTFLVAGDIQNLGVDAKRGIDEAFAKGLHEKK